MKLLLFAVLTVLFLGMSSFADKIDASVGICFSDARGLESTDLTVNGAEVDLGSGGSEPLFSSHIRLDGGGEVFLVRKEKTDILLGKAETPFPTTGCPSYPFVWNPNVKVQEHISKTPPYPHCSFPNGCTTLYDERTRVTISPSPEETITFVGAWARKP